MTTDEKVPTNASDEPRSVILDGKLLDALNDYRDKKIAMRSASPKQKTRKQSEYLLASELLAHTLDHIVREKVNLDTLGYSAEQIGQIKDNRTDVAAQIHGVAYTLPKRS